MKRIIILLAALFLAMSFSSCSEQKGYKAEANTGGDSSAYPYLVRTPSATWYLAKDDMEMLGEEAFYDGLFALLDDAEADFADAREALKGFISDETPAVDIYTDFCGKAGIKEDMDPLKMETVYEKSFLELYREWAEWNEEQCEALGITIS